MSIRISEIFASVQGEGHYSGVPSVFVRVFGCNFTCMGFSRPEAVNPEFKDLKEVFVETDGPPQGVTDVRQLDGDSFTRGCDSRYSWDPRFKHLSAPMNVGELMTAIQMFLRNGDGTPIRHIVFTGGEPLLHQRELIPAILGLAQTNSMDSVTFETNGSIPLSEYNRQALADWVGVDAHRTVLFSNSVKLSHSGEPRDKRINHDTFLAYRDLLGRVRPGQVIVSGKYVVSEADADFEEAYGVHRALFELLTPWGTTWNELTSRFPAYAMPLGADVEQYRSRATAVALKCMEHGFRYSPRVHLDLFGNKIGT